MREEESRRRKELYGDSVRSCRKKKRVDKRVKKEEKEDKAERFLERKP